MNLRTLTGAAVAVAAAACAGAAQADVIAFNSAPTDTWYFGSGNDYAPANTVVLTTDAGDELYLRAHQTFEVAPASDGHTYSFAAGLPFISFDWGFDTAASGVTARISMYNYAGGYFAYDALAPGNDNEVLNGSTQNSARLNWFAPATGFDPNVDGVYRVKLDVHGLAGGDKSLHVLVNVGQGGGGPVPEPATWALMIMGFGGAGAALRRRRALAAA